MAIIPHPAIGARQLGAQALSEAGSMRDRAMQLRLSRLQELERDRAKLLGALDRLRQRREMKKAQEQNEPAFGGWGGVGGMGAGAGIGALVGGPAGALIGAGIGGAAGGGVEQAMSGDVAGGTQSMMEGANWGLEASYDYAQIPNRWGGGGTPKLPGKPPGAPG